jgi:hypothetical protein
MGELGHYEPQKTCQNPEKTMKIISNFKIHFLGHYELVLSYSYTPQKALKITKNISNLL